MLIVAGDSRDDDEVVAKSAILGGVVPGMVGPAADLLPEVVGAGMGGRSSSEYNTNRESWIEI